VSNGKRNAAVFAVTSQGSDIYTAMTRIAVASLRISNPNLSVTVACDRDTDRAMRQAGNPLIGEVDRWLVVETPEGEPGFRNRFVKTRLRRLLDGPFLFLDSDVLVRGDLSELFELDTDMAGARNHSRTLWTIWDEDRDVLNTMGWIIDTDRYINGGVILYGDTAGSRRLADDWHERWTQSFKKTRTYRDQPSFNTALQVINPKFVMLPDRFNAQFKSAPSVAKDAVVWHYYYSSTEELHTPFELLARDMIKGAELDREEVDRMVQSIHPWQSNTMLDDWAAAKVMKRGSYHGLEWALLQRRPVSHILGRIRYYCSIGTK
jgi:hypothetical protein